MSVRCLIVNADDYNTDAQRNRGILEAATQGIVTSISVLANTPLLEMNPPGLRDTTSIGFGIHLNLTKGTPLSTCVKSLVTVNGQFLNKREAWRRALTAGFDLSEVKNEFAAQITRLLQAGIVLDHIDGNNHIHVFSGIAEVVAQLAKEFGITRIRVPWERFNRWGDLCRAGGLKKLFLRCVAQRAARVFTDYGLTSPDHFAGLQFPRVDDYKSLVRFLRTLPPGTTELMCHPGYRNPCSPFSSVARERELGALIHPEVIKTTVESGIRLSRFADLNQVVSRPLP
jgi:chitin disaccharide deacetylase